MKMHEDGKTRIRSEVTELTSVTGKKTELR